MSTFTAQIQIIHNGIPILPAETCNEHAIVKAKQKDDIIIGFVGALTVDKGIDLLVDAYLNAKSKQPDIQTTLVIIGDGPLREILQDTVNQTPWKNEIFFLGFRDNIPGLLTCFDIFISPGRRSGFDLAILEAMRASIAIVASDTGGNREAIADSGILLAQTNAIEITNEIIKLVQDENYRNTLATKAKQRFEEYFALNVMAQKYEQLYSRILTR